MNDVIDLASRLRRVARQAPSDEPCLVGNVEASAPLLRAAADEIDRLRTIVAALQFEVAVRNAKGGE